MNKDHVRKKNVKLKINSNDILVGSGINVEKVLKKIPDVLKLHAKSLILLIKDKKLFNWNSNGELVFNDKTIKCSNIISLLTHALTHHKKKPIGYKYFYSMLKKVTIAHFLIQKNLKKYTRDTENKEWRPPGTLIKRTF